MAYTISQRSPRPDVTPGSVGEFTIDLGLTPGSGPVRGSRELFEVTLPEGLTVPAGTTGMVSYVVNGEKPKPVSSEWRPDESLLAFWFEVHLNDGSSGQNGFFSIGIQVDAKATVGLRHVDEAISLGGLVKAPLDINIVSPYVPGTIVTVAGTGTKDFSGDGGAATAAQLNMPWGVAVASDGTLYIADCFNYRVRRVRGGTITTVAGTGTAGFGGDGGVATAAQLNKPWGVAVASDGTLYIADLWNNRVRWVRDGTITTVAGTGTEGFSGDGAAATAAELNYPSGVAVAGDGTLYIADSGNQRVRRVSTSVHQDAIP